MSFVVIFSEFAEKSGEGKNTVTDRKAFGVLEKSRPPTPPNHRYTGGVIEKCAIGGKRNCKKIEKYAKYIDTVS